MLPPPLLLLGLLVPPLHQLVLLPARNALLWKAGLSIERSCHIVAAAANGGRSIAIPTPKPIPNGTSFATAAQITVNSIAAPILQFPILSANKLLPPPPPKSLFI
jgi:hypothetical protein